MPVFYAGRDIAPGVHGQLQQTAGAVQGGAAIGAGPRAPQHRGFRQEIQGQ